MTAISKYEVYEFGYKVHTMLYPVLGNRLVTWDELIHDIAHSVEVKQTANLLDTPRTFFTFKEFCECVPSLYLNRWNSFVHSCEELYYDLYDKLHDLSQNELESMGYLETLLSLN